MPEAKNINVSVNNLHPVLYAPNNLYDNLNIL